MKSNLLFGYNITRKNGLNLRLNKLESIHPRISMHCLMSGFNWTSGSRIESDIMKSQRWQKQKTYINQLPKVTCVIKVVRYSVLDRLNNQVSAVR